MASSKSKDLTLTSSVDLLAPGVSMPRLGFGIYRVQPSETIDVVLTALEAGYRHIDSAQLYNNEAELGQAMRKSGVARKDVFLTTKIRYPGMNKAKTWKKVVDSVKKVSGVETATGKKRKRADDGVDADKAQADSGAEYVDLFLVHTPYGGPNAKKERREMWAALERAFEEGKARAIGVSNYKVEHLEEMREYAKVWPPHVNQIQVYEHPVSPPPFFPRAPALDDERLTSHTAQPLDAATRGRRLLSETRHRRPGFQPACPRRQVGRAGRGRGRGQVREVAGAGAGTLCAAEGMGASAEEREAGEDEGERRGV